MSRCCRLSLLNPMTGRITRFCKVVAMLVVFLLVGQAKANPCEVSAGIISGKCGSFEKILEVAKKEFVATLNAESFLSATVYDPLRVELKFGNCAFHANVYKITNVVVVQVDTTAYSKFMKIEGTESGVKLSDAKQPDPICQSLTFEPHENAYRLPFSWTISQSSPEVSLTFTGQVKFIEPEDRNSSGLSALAWVGIGCGILAILILMGVAIVAAVYCKCKKRSNSTPKVEAKSGELQLDKTQQTKEKPAKANKSKVKPAEAKSLSNDQREIAKKQEVVKKVRSAKQPSSTAMPTHAKQAWEDILVSRKKDIAKVETDVRQLKEDHAKSAGSKSKFKSLNNKLSRQIEICGCRKRIGKPCDECVTAISKSSNRQSSSSSGSRTTKTTKITKDQDGL